MTDKLSAIELKNCLSTVKLLAMDADGILTDGGIYYTDDGKQIKRFNVKDGQGLKLVGNCGINLAIISASNSPAILHRAESLGIANVFVGVEDKLEVLKELCQTLNITFSEVAYVGDDINDLTIMKRVRCPLTVADAIYEVKETAVYVTQKQGGQGAIREICDLLIGSCS
ncbi:MAG: HAD-IIIA family hydrolase [Prochloron sp. SP5CPC1]|nr:HAD-IIIA family hydrolase [Candidatus Paraprochloron terpiosi SP5CPC1]